MVNPDLGPEQPAAWLYAQTESNNAPNTSLSLSSSFWRREQETREPNRQSVKNLERVDLIPYITKGISGICKKFNERVSRIPILSLDFVR